MSATFLRRGVCGALGAWLCTVGLTGSAAQPPVDVTTGPRLQGSGLPAYPPLVVSGGEVVLELTVDAGGVVTEVQPLRATPPFTEALTTAVLGWRFSPSIRLVEKQHIVAPGRVLVAAIFRPPTLYGGATAGTPPHPAGLPSVQVPQVLGLTQPVYPPTARGGGMVLFEIEMNARAEPLEYHILATTGGFEEAALDAVRTWRFSPPAEADPPAHLYAYALVAFREPIAPGSGPP